MATQFLLFLLMISCYALTIVKADDTGFVGSVDPSVLEKKQTMSHFRFYFHEIFNGTNATSVTVVDALPKYNTTTFLGMVGVMDNILTLGPDRNSKAVGRVQGLYAATSQTEVALVPVLNFILSQGKYNGSYITVLGWNLINLKVREMPVIGGSGAFRFARGYVEVNTIFLDIQTRSTIEYNIYVSHY
ncbi:dirigent protein 22-like [Abrus precatorius]|uniref:Dirigent protein n=1 Tax=Abrus precatorius TaxID=3816 RepID=A0A8B8K249_ABRPR|nr:dirigent protein 22-like [Abrus precatorius]